MRCLIISVKNINIMSRCFWGVDFGRVEKKKFWPCSWEEKASCQTISSVLRWEKLREELPPSTWYPSLDILFLRNTLSSLPHWCLSSKDFAQKWGWQKAIAYQWEQHNHFWRLALKGQLTVQENIYKRLHKPTLPFIDTVSSYFLLLHPRHPSAVRKATCWGRWLTNSGSFALHQLSFCCFYLIARLKSEFPQSVSSKALILRLPCKYHFW